MAYLWVTLLGRPGAGKTTVGRTLACSDHFGLGTHYVSGSRLLDDYVAHRRDGWETVKEEKDHGRTADPSLTHTLLEERIESMSGDGVVLLDGFPKSLAEIARTEAAIPGSAIDLAVLLDCPANECVDRIEHRLVCGECGAVTDTHAGVDVSSPCDEERCDGSFVRRKDDGCESRVGGQGNESAVVLANHFRELGRLAEVDALDHREAVIAEVVTAIEAGMGAPSSQNRG